MNRLTTQEIRHEVASGLATIFDAEYLTDMASEDFYSRQENDNATHDEAIDAIFEMVSLRIRNALIQG